GMCGGIVGALNAESAVRSPSSRLAIQLAYNAGRIASYAVAGAIAGLIGAHAANLPIGNVLPVGALIAGLFMIALGLYLAGWWHAIAALERIGGYLWRVIQPLGRRFLPVRNPLHAFGLGLVWGWLPCGLVYSALALAVVAGSAQSGASVMLAFGLGTLPMLLVLGKAAEVVLKIVRAPVMRQIAGGLVVLFGVYTIYSAMIGGGHEHHHHHTAAGIQLSVSG
ncbi:MAG: sulfite exporter TauE/SafE family protein, partial [Hyphomicrobiales bacterium]|nr:sulfite exporter TauE/SafE family protein [Hyphomicrobiales bacterium]